MNEVLIVAVLACVLLMTSVLVKPNIEIKGHSFGLYWMIVIAAVIYLMLRGYISPAEIGRELTKEGSINPIGILVLFISMTMLSIYLDEAGFFGYLAAVSVKRAGKSSLRLFFILYVMVSVLTVFTSNDIIILTFTPFICHFAKHAKIDPLPFLFTEFVAANTWSMMLIVGNPTNVYLATSAGYDFFGYFKVMFLPTLASGTVALLVLLLLFRKSLSKEIEDTNPVPAKLDKTVLTIGLIHLIGCIILLVISSYVNIDMWKVSLGFAVSLFVITLIYRFIQHQRPVILEQCLKRAPWELIPFVLSMFVLVTVLGKYGWTEKLAQYLGGGNALYTYGISSFVIANIMNNIPMSVLFSGLLGGLSGSAYTEALFASVVGSNVGAFFTPLGALAGIMWSGILKKHGISFSFIKFIKYGIIISVPALFAALAVIGLMV